MKMTVGTRIIFSVFLLLILCVCIFIILAAFELFPANIMESIVSGFTSTGLRYVWAVVALVFAVVAVGLLFFGASKKEPNVVLLNSTVDGSVCITIDALVELAQRYLNEVHGIMTQRIVIVPTAERCVRINILLSTRPEVEIPKVTESVTDGIKYYIEKYSGINAAYVNIKILPVKHTQYPVK